MLMSLFGANLEMGVRVFFFTDFLKMGLRLQQQQGRRGQKEKDEDRDRFFKRGRMRVQDGSNDMVVEYVSSLAAAAVLVWLVPTGAFEFSTEPVSSDQVITITMFQIVPELFLDFFCTFVEVNGGLIKLHKDYWSKKTGAKRGSFLGDLTKSLTCKFWAIFIFTPIVLMVSTK